jgi:hypothetical protein
MEGGSVTRHLLAAPAGTEEQRRRRRGAPALGWGPLSYVDRRSERTRSLQRVRASRGQRAAQKRLRLQPEGVAG